MEGSGWDEKTYHSASVQITLQAAVGPGVHNLIKGVLSRLGGGIGGLRRGGTDVGSSSAKSRSSSAGDGVTHDLGPVLADKSAQLVELRALRNCLVLVTISLLVCNNRRTIDAVLVAELLELRLAPRVNELVSQGSISVLGGLLGALALLLHAQVSETRVAANRGDKFITLLLGLAIIRISLVRATYSGGLRRRESMSVEPLLQVGFCSHSQIWSCSSQIGLYPPLQVS